MLAADCLKEGRERVDHVLNVIYSITLFCVDDLICSFTYNDITVLIPDFLSQVIFLIWLFLKFLKYNKIK